MKYTVTHYYGIGERPRVILLDRDKGKFPNQFNNIDELRNFLSEDCIIYFVADKGDNRINGLDNWHEGKFDFEKLKDYGI